MSNANPKKIIVVHVYSLAMPWINIQLKSAKETVRFLGGKIEDNDETNQLIVYDENGVIMGKFNMPDVAGWWTTP